MKDIGQVVLFHRNQAKQSRSQLADIAGVGKTVIYDIENGKESVRFSTLLKVLEALNITVTLHSPLMKFFDEQREKKPEVTDKIKSSPGRR